MIAMESDELENGGITILVTAPGHLSVTATGRLCFVMATRRALVIGVDGLRFDRVDATFAPRLTGLVRNGLFAPSLLDVGSGTRTDSGPGWSTIATGVWPDKHGVLDNSFADARYEQYPDFLTRLKRADPDRTTFVAVDWPPLVERGTFGKQIDTIVVGDGEEHGYLVEDERMATAAIDGLHRGDALFVYLGCVDFAGHASGPLSTVYTQAIGAVDRWIGELLDAVAARDTHVPEEWLIVVTTDHGHRDEGNHGGHSDVERGTFILATGPDLPTGRRDDTALVDLAPTVLCHFGVPVPPEFDGRPLQR
jgi:predicted AlkP superfamily pyrophosphatase or phosphodiesterase